MILKIPHSFFRAIRKESSKTQVLWMRWLAFGEELQNPDILGRLIIDTPTLPELEIKEIYAWGMKLLEGSPFFEKDMISLPEYTELIKDFEQLKNKVFVIESQIEDIRMSNPTKKAEKTAKIDNFEQIKDVLDYLNDKISAKYNINASKNREHISARLKEGYGVEVLKQVIDKKVAEWINTPMEKYLRPITLFNSSKFESYVNQKNITNNTQKNINNLSDAVSKAKELYGISKD